MKDGYKRGFTCFILIVLVTAAFYKGTLFKSSKITWSNSSTKSEQGNEAAVSKKVKEYAPDSVQARIQAEVPFNINSSASVDRLAPRNKDIKDRYANSQNVIKGYVYSTEYFWYGSDTFNQLYTKSIINIVKSYKGSLKPGDKITVIEHGGITTLKEWVERTSSKEYKSFEKVPENYDPYFGKSPNTLVDYAGFIGISPMRTGQDVVLFLVPDKSGVFGKIGEPGYRLVETDGGKMLLKNGIYQTMIAPDDIKDFIKQESCSESEIDNLIKDAEGKN